MFSRIPILVIMAFFAINAEAESVTHFPQEDDEDYLADTLGEPTEVIDGALCFHAESLSVYDRRMIEDYAKKNEGLTFEKLTFGNLCLHEGYEKGMLWPTTVPESFLAIPGSYIKKGSISDYYAPWAFAALLILLAVIFIFGHSKSRNH